MQINTDQNGFLQDLNAWDPSVAENLAQRENIILTAAHWEVINLLREFYFNYSASPAIRTLVKLMQEKYGPEKGNSIYLHSLFPGGAALQANKIAGLPKPVHCI